MDKVLFLCNVTMGTFCHSIQLTYNLGFFFNIPFLPGSEYNSYMNHQTFQFLFFSFFFGLGFVTILKEIPKHDTKRKITKDITYF